MMTETTHETETAPRPAHLAHHYATPQQQFDSGKLGIWLFLGTEILLFSGLFCGYAVFRANHPEIFAYAHLYLSKPLGALNTVVLIFSSFTMASAVRAAQLGQRRRLVLLLTVTLLCGFAFLGVKFVEYKNKWEEGLLTGQSYRPKEPPPGAVLDAPLSLRERAGVRGKQSTDHGSPSPLAPLPKGEGKPKPAPPAPLERSTIAPAAIGKPGISPQWLADKGAPPERAWVGPEPNNVQVFFGIYFAMTGLHGAHVIAGLCVIAWILRRAVRGDFGPDYFYPVDFTGLYWHLVDLIWIYLFPLLYLIT
jgi:cytochrome c oxidase subunit III